MVKGRRPDGDRQPQRDRRRAGDRLRQARRPDAHSRAPALLAVVDRSASSPRPPETPTTIRAGLGHDGDPDGPGGTGFRWILPDRHAGRRQDDGPPTPTASRSSSGSPPRLRRTPRPPSPRPSSPTTRPGDPGEQRLSLRAAERGRQACASSRPTSPIPRTPPSTLDPIRQEIVTCTVYNSFNYAPAIQLEKVNSPTEVRGDLRPPAPVTVASYLDSRHQPGQHAAVQRPRDRQRLRPGVAGPSDRHQRRRHRRRQAARPRARPGSSPACTRSPPASRPTRPARPRQHRDGHRNRPLGYPVTDDDTDDVDVFNPAISFVKQVNGEDTATYHPWRGGNYTYASPTRGTPRSRMSSSRTTTADPSPAACSPTRGADAPG